MREEAMNIGREEGARVGSAQGVEQGVQMQKGKAGINVNTANAIVAGLARFGQKEQPPQEQQMTPPQQGGLGKIQM